LDANVDAKGERKKRNEKKKRKKEERERKKRKPSEYASSRALLCVPVRSS